MNNVTVVDYGAGNLLNVVRALEHCGAVPLVTDSAAEIARAQRVIFPGVGAFGDCMKALHTRGIAGALREYMQSDRLFLGICVGMQVMFDAGEEFGEHAGLGVIAGRVVAIPAEGRKIPHIGWEELQPAAAWEGSILEPLSNMAGGGSAYFVHSYMGVPADARDRLADVEYDGTRICAAVRRGNVYGCQFHPEKSGEVGLAILRQFLNISQ